MTENVDTKPQTEASSSYEEKLQALLAIELNKRIQESNQSPSLLEKLTGQAVALTAFVTALASLAGAIIAISAGLKSQLVQGEIEITQEQILERQNRIDENSRILNMYQLTSPAMTCQTIPTDENDKWSRYKGCLVSAGGPKELLSEYTASTRFECVKTHVKCNPENGVLK